jgi:prepilin signal peptidase PulO-like enzyme (type II secretory pathway)
MTGIIQDEIVLLASASYLITVLLVIAVIDARKMIIPNELNIVNAFGGALFASLLRPSLLSAGVGGVLGLSVLILFRFGYRSLRGREGLGLGDAKFMGGAGLWVGWEGVAPLLLLSSAFALLFLAVRGSPKRRWDPAQKLPFGPFLCAGTFAVWSAQSVGLIP